MLTAPRTIWSILVVFLLGTGCATPLRQSDALSNAEAGTTDPVASSEQQPADDNAFSMEPTTSPQQRETADLRDVTSSADPPSDDRVDPSMPTDEQGPAPMAHLTEVAPRVDPSPRSRGPQHHQANQTTQQDRGVTPTSHDGVLPPNCAAKPAADDDPNIGAQVREVAYDRVPTAAPAGDPDRELVSDPSDSGPQPEVPASQAATKLSEPVGTEPADTDPPGDWKAQLQEAIRSFEAHVQSKSFGDEKVRQADGGGPFTSRPRRRASGRPQQDTETAQLLGDPEQEFWKHLMYGLATYLDSKGPPDADRRATLALRELRESLGHMATISLLEVRNLAFCTSVASYGRYTPFEEYEFKPDQAVLLYVEIDNIAAEETLDSKFETSLQATYQIVGSDGRRVPTAPLQLEGEICENRRRDYFIPYRLWMPREIAPGAYTLQLTIEDKKGQKFGQSSIDFAIKN